eukprot:130904_1
MESGDKIILSKGIYTMENNFSFYEKDIQIEGMGQECLLYGDAYGSAAYDVNKNLSVSNISLKDVDLNVKGGNIWLTNCIVRSWIGIDDEAPPNTKLDCMRCEFIDNDFSAIYVNSESTLSVIEKKK